MRAVVHERYGPPDVLRLEEVERPVPRDGELLVRVRAAAVGRTDCALRATDLGFLWQVPILALLTWRLGDKKVILPLGPAGA